MHLNFSSLNHAAVHFLACLFGIGAIRESYKTETLHAMEKNEKHKIACRYNDKPANTYGQ